MEFHMYALKTDVFLLVLGSTGFLQLQAKKITSCKFRHSLLKEVYTKLLGACFNFILYALFSVCYLWIYRLSLGFVSGIISKRFTFKRHNLSTVEHIWKVCQTNLNRMSSQILQSILDGALYRRV